MDPTRTKHILEACLLVAARPLGVPQLEALFDEDDERPDRDAIRAALKALSEDYEGRGIELVEVASGWRLQSRADVQRWTGRLFQEKVPRYSRALLETLVLVAYRQPITRGEIEEVRGVAVSSNIVRTLQERQWVREVGYKDVPGKPALLGTTRQFLDYFNLKRLEDLPTLGELKDLDAFDAVLAGTGPVDGAEEGDAANDDGGGTSTVDEATADEATADEATADEATADEATADGATADGAAEGSAGAGDRRRGGAGRGVGGRARFTGRNRARLRGPAGRAASGRGRLRGRASKRSGCRAALHSRCGRCRRRDRRGVRGRARVRDRGGARNGGSGDGSRGRARWRRAGSQGPRPMTD